VRPVNLPLGTRNLELGTSRRRPGRALAMLIVALVAVAAGGAAGYFLANRLPKPNANTDPGPAPPDKITALGRLQPEGGVVPVYGPPGDRIAKLYPLAPGASLQVDDPIAELASYKDRLLEVQVAETQLTEAKSARDAAERAGNQKIRAAQAELNQAKANKVSDLAAIDAKLDYLAIQAKSAAKQVARLKDLKDKGGTVADEDFEKVELLQAQADAELAATRAMRKKTETTYDETQKAAEAKIDAAKAELEEALARAPIKSSEEKLALAKQVRELTIIRAPVAGTVLKVIGREGQPTGLEPILQMAALGKMTVVAEVYESDVERLAGWVRSKPVPVEVTNPALPKALAGTVRTESDITRMIARNQVFAVGPREDADRRVVEVVVHLDDASAAAAGRFVGLQVTVAFTPGK
jgi:HlyD family secretion protein